MVTSTYSKGVSIFIVMLLLQKRCLYSRDRLSVLPSFGIRLIATRESYEDRDGFKGNTEPFMKFTLSDYTQYIRGLRIKLVLQHFDIEIFNLLRYFHTLLSFASPDNSDCVLNR